MKFLADEHIELSIVTGLKELEIDIVSTDEIDRRGFKDTDILNYARESNRVLVTRDSDFLRLHAKGVKHNGIIFIPKFLPIGIIIEEIEKVSLLFETENLSNTVIFIPLK